MRGERHDEALSALEMAVELGYRGDFYVGQGWQLSIRDNFMFEEIRETPRFRALIQTIEADLARQREILAERTARWIEELAANRNP